MQRILRNHLSLSLAVFMIFAAASCKQNAGEAKHADLQRMNLQVDMDEKQLVLKTKMPEGTRQDWLTTWTRLFTACFHRPLIILPTDNLRRDLWNWIDGKPSIEVWARDSSVLSAGTLTVSNKHP